MAYTRYPIIWVAEAEHLSEFQANPEYRMRPYLKTNKTKQGLQRWLSSLEHYAEDSVTRTRMLAHSHP